MNIAILIPALVGGGAERVAQVLGDYYVQNGDNVYYFIGNTGLMQDYPVKGEVIQTGIKSCMEGDLNDWGRLAKLIIASAKMRMIKRKYKVDVAISFMEEFNYLNVLSRGRETVIARVCTILSKSKGHRGFLYKKNIVKFFYAKADRVIVTSRYALKDMYCHYGVPLKKMMIIPNAVKERKPYERSELWQYGEKVILCIGRLETEKQQERIIRAFCYVQQKEKKARLIILGKGSQLNYLKKVCGKYGIKDKVIFTGFVKNTEYYMRNARVFVMASKVEGFPNSMIEAMNYGVPVVTTDSPGGCGEIVGKSQEKMDNNTFLLCKYGILTPVMPDEKVKMDSLLINQEIILGKAILKILMDDEIYRKYSTQSLKRAEMYHIDRVIKKWNYIVRKSDKIIDDTE